MKRKKKSFNVCWWSVVPYYLTKDRRVFQGFKMVSVSHYLCKWKQVQSGAKVVDGRAGAVLQISVQLHSLELPTQKEDLILRILRKDGRMDQQTHKLTITVCVKSLVRNSEQRWSVIPLVSQKQSWKRWKDEKVSFNDCSIFPNVCLLLNKTYEGKMEMKRKWKIIRGPWRKKIDFLCKSLQYKTRPSRPMWFDMWIVEWRRYPTNQPTD